MLGFSEEAQGWIPCKITTGMDDTKDLGFPVSKDKDLVRSVRDVVEDRRINLVISPEILSFYRRKSKNGTRRKNQTCVQR